MAGGQERILRDRIRAVQATKKITRAMELIAGSRIVKAQQRVHAAVPYSEQITEVVHHLAEAGASSDHPILLGRPEVRSICYVIITSDRGLCGGYNSGVLRAAEGMKILQAGTLHAYLAYVLVLGVLILIWLGGPM